MVEWKFNQIGVDMVLLVSISHVNTWKVFFFLMEINSPD